MLQIDRPKRRRLLARRLAKVLAVVLAIRLVGFPPVTLLAQDPLVCGLFGTCLPLNATTLPGIPQTPLRIVQPWDQVVKGSAANAWAPIEKQARAELAVIHGIANDDRLAHFGIDELRALIYSNLLALTGGSYKGTLTAEEVTAALDAFKAAIVAQRVKTAQHAIDEYYRWSRSPCTYDPPQGFGFEGYDAGPHCRLQGSPLVLNVIERPPTAQQFMAYGAALANQQFTSADAQAAFSRMNDSMAIVGSFAAAAVVGGIATLLAATIPAVGIAFAGIMGSASVATVTTFAAGSVLHGAWAAIGPTMAASTGIGVAASLPALIIIAAAVTIVGIIMVVEDSKILPTLQDRLASARQPPDIVAMLQDPAQAMVLSAAFMDQTLPDYTTERLAEAPQPPTAPAPGDPEFEVNGQKQSVLETRALDGLFRQTFMSGGWFVTRTRKTEQDPWGPWRWSLSIPYTSPDLNRDKQLEIQPDGFLDIDHKNPAPPTTDEEKKKLAVKGTSFDTNVLVQSVATRATVRFAGNRAPVLSPTASTTPVIGVPVTFSAGASDPDGDAITIRWLVEDPVGVFNPINDTGTGAMYTFAHAGTNGVTVVATDSKGAASREQFYVRVGAVVPALTLTPPPELSITEGQTVVVKGTLDYPQYRDGFYGTTVTLTVDWGDGTTTREDFPCRFGSGSHCTFSLPSRLIGGNRVAPWNFEYSHTYAFSPTQSVPPTAEIKVFASTGDNISSPVTSYTVNIANVAPAVIPDPTCPLLIPFGTICVGTGAHEVAPGAPFTIGARIVDAVGAKHAVKVFWGDGLQSALVPGCTDAGCPAPHSESQGPDRAASHFDVTHTYYTPGTYPVQIIVNDGGPGGSVTYNTNAVIFGAAVQGPTNVVAQAPATFTFTPTLPARGTLDSLTPDCGPGTLTGSDATSFTCVFPDVPYRTPTSVGVHASIAGRTIDSGLSVEIAPRPPVISGPPSVVAGKSASFTYAPLPFSTNTDIPSCSGAIIAFSPGSLECAFADSPTPYTGTVTITRMILMPPFVGVFPEPLTTTLSVNVVPDLEPPVLTLPGTISAPSTSHAGAIVHYAAASAVDAVSGPAAVSCSPASGAQFAIGTTTVSCAADDWKGNHATGTFAVVVADVTPPTLTVPTAIAIDATAPAGAIATFAATAVDAVPSSPPVSCLPASGSTFPIGTTKVTCRATDAAGNQASSQFAVTVRGAADQLATLSTNIDELSLDRKTEKALMKDASAALDAVARNRTDKACRELTQLMKTTSRDHRNALTAAQADAILTQARAIGAVLGCR